MKSLGRAIDSVGFVLALIILRKLPPEIRNNMNRVGRKDHWDLNSLRAAIEIGHLSATEIGHLRATENETLISL